MNDGVLVVVHAWSGDQQLVEDTLEAQLHHERPVLLLSPEDEPAIIDHPDVTCRQAGLHGYQGHQVPYRQIDHWRLALEEQAEWFLLNDADSFVLDPVLPDFLFSERDVLWTTPIGKQGNWRGHAGGDWPWPNFQPPYFCHREWLEAALRVAEAPQFGDDEPLGVTGPEGRIVYTDVRYDDPFEPYDWGWTLAPDGLYNHVIMRSNLAARANPLGRMGPGAYVLDGILRYGTTFVHPVKTTAGLHLMMKARNEFLKGEDSFAEEVTL